MSVQDHRYHRPAPGVDLQGRLSPFWRGLSELVWRLEHGFERARADGRPEEDTRVRIFLILLAFSFDWLPHQPYAALQSEDRFRATHVISLPVLTPLWLWQNYHLIHHLYPAVPCYRYAQVWEDEKTALLAKGARDLWA